MKKYLSKALFFIVATLALFPFLFSRPVKADSRNFIAVDFSLYDRLTDRIVNDKAFYSTVTANVYENGKFLWSAIPNGNNTYDTLIIGETSLKLGCKYDVDFIIPENYELRNIYNNSGVPSNHYKISGRRLSFTFDSIIKKASETGLTFTVNYYNGAKPKPTVTPAPTKLKTQITLSKTSYKLTSGAKSFSLNAKVKNGAALTYKSNNTSVITVSKAGKITIKNPGTATVTVSSAATSKYTGARKKISFTVSPKKVTSVTAVSPKTQTAKITWKKDSSVTGYQVIIAKDKNFKKSKATYNVKSSKTVSKTISKLKKGTTYYVRVRSYKTVSNNKIYGAYSDIRTVKIK